MNDDAELLCRYANDGSEGAFTALVRRHIDLVYATALRRTGGDAHRAADVSQQVFSALARNARKLSRHPVLSAWLHTAARNSAIDLMISEQRRRIREEVAVDLSAANASPENPEWDRVKEFLDDAVAELPETDRAAVILRFLERKPYAEIGAALRVSEDAARVRTDRALDKLRGLLARRGITSTASALAMMVTSQSGVSAPAGLAVALAARALVPVSGGFLVGVTSIMNIKLLVPVAAGAFILGGLGMHALTRDNAAVPPPLPAPAQDAQLIASLRAEIARQGEEVARMARANDALAAERDQLAAAAASRNSAPAAMTPAQQQQRTMLNYLRQISAARDQFVYEYGRAPASVLELIGVDKFIREVNSVDGEDYSNLPMSGDRPLTVTTASGVSITYEPTPFQPPPPPTEEQRAATTRAKAAMDRVREIGPRVKPMLAPAIEAYRTANDGKSPPNNQALIPFFPNAQAGADFVEYLEAEKATRRK